jgi:hypothetical protein
MGSKKTFSRPKKEKTQNNLCFLIFKIRGDFYIKSSELLSNFLFFATASNASSIASGAPEILIKLPDPIIDKFGQLIAIRNLPFKAITSSPDTKISYGKCAA